MPRRSGRILVLTLVLPWVLVGQGRARAEDEAEGPLKGLSGAAALEIATALAADAMKGRQTGFEGGRLADDYVAQAMAEMGLDPKDSRGAYLEPFEFAATRVKAPVALVIDGKTLAYGKEYREAFGSGHGKVEAEVVFVGYGISSPANGFDEVGAADLKGKVVLALLGAPKDRAIALGPDASLGAKITAAAYRGAKALLLCDGEQAPLAAIAPASFRPGFPVLALSAAAANRLLGKGTTLDSERAKRDTADAQKPVTGGVRVALEVNVEHVPNAKGHNALGAIRGSDPDLRDEIVLVGAHGDGFGMDVEGKPLNGADDNASGVAVLLHVARTLKENGWRPKRMVLFVVFGGGKAGHVGAGQVAEGLPFDHDGITCALTVTRVGQGRPTVSLLDGSRFPAMNERLRGTLKAAGVDALAVGSVDRSAWDHSAFAEKGVPAFGLSTRGEHPSAGTQADVAGNLKPECLEAAARALGALVVALGDDPARLERK